MYAAIIILKYKLLSLLDQLLTPSPTPMLARLPLVIYNMRGKIGRDSRIFWPESALFDPKTAKNGEMR